MPSKQRRLLVLYYVNLVRNFVDEARRVPSFLRDVVGDVEFQRRRLDKTLQSPKGVLIQQLPLGVRVSRFAHKLVAFLCQ